MTRQQGRTLAAMAALAALALPAQAQSRLTISGAVDLAMRSVHNSNGTLNSLVSGGNATSRLVVRGSEDLGGGLVASFWLEGSLAADNGVAGTGAQFWDRQSTVSLSGPFGEIRIGRDWTPVYTGYVFSDPWLNMGVGTGSNFLNASVSTVYQAAFGSALNPTTLSRSNNAVEYWLPANLGGLYGHVMVSPGEGNNAGGGFRYHAARLGYKTGGLDVAVYGGSTRIDAADRNLTQAGLYGAYRMDGGATWMASATRSSFASASHWHWSTGVRVPMGVWLFKASYNHLDQRGRNAAGADIDANDAHQFAVGADYLLSKRTALYATVARMVNRGNARFALPNGVPNLAPGTNATGFDLGLRHSF